MAELKESCALAGVYGHQHASRALYLGLFSLQHRGQESCGLIVSHRGKTSNHKGMGLVWEVFTPKVLERLKGNIGIAHTRYSTTGSCSERNIQPFYIEHRGKMLAVAHNGNLVNSASLRERLEKKGAIFQTSMDTEIIMHLLVRSKAPTYSDKIYDVLSHLKGAFSLLFYTPDSLIAARDPWGWRPLCLGKLGQGYMVASESCAFDLVGARYLRELEPGEILTIDKNGLRSRRLPTTRTAHCVFEFIYFSRPDSRIFGESVYLARKELGRTLAREFPYPGDLVVPIPDSGSVAALGFAQEKNLPFELGLIRNHYVGRTFIQPFQKNRDLSVRIKLNPVRDVLKGKRVIIIEDSIVRGTTSRIRVRNLREAGAKEVYMGVSCPPIKFPCFYGIDFPSREELVAARYSVEEIGRAMDVDGLHYLSLDGMLSAMALPREKFCTACFTGKYPIKPGKFTKDQFET